jgi:vitamin B12 transporter
VNRYFAAGLALTGASAAWAQPQSATADVAPVDVAPVIVTATRTAQSAEDTLAATTVITRADIDRLQAQTLQDLLVGLPGVAVANNGGPGKFTSLFLRGSNSNQVLVLIDGIKVGNASSGTAAFEQIPVDQIERIEIVRGPRSSLYGSDAVGGVIQIFTRGGAGRLTPSFSVGGGTYNSWKSEAGLAGRVGNAWYSGSVTGSYTDGINACRGSDSGGCYTYEPDRDGFWDTTGSMRGGYRFDDGAEVSGRWLRTYGDTHYDGSYANQSKLVQQVLGGHVRLPRLGAWQASISGGQSEDQSIDYENGHFSGQLDTLRNSASLQNDFTLAARQRFTAGADYVKDHLFSDTAYTDASRENWGAFAQYLGGFGASDVQLSARSDRNQQFGTHATGSIAYGYRFSPALRVSASFGSAFKAPTFNDLYYPFGFGNPQLRPEKSYSSELGFGGRLSRFDWSLNAYQTDVIDMIVLDQNYTPQNFDRARIRGLEAQSSWRWRQWHLAAAATLLDPRNRSAGADDHLLPRRPMQTARLDVDRSFGRYSAGATLTASGRSFDDADNTQALGGYGLLDLRAGWHCSSKWLLQARLANVFGKHYETVQYYNQPGRTLFVTLRYTPASH